jgi:hypothetical protein
MYPTADESARAINNNAPTSSCALLPYASKMSPSNRNWWRWAIGLKKMNFLLGLSNAPKQKVTKSGFLKHLHDHVIQRRFRFVLYDSKQANSTLSDSELSGRPVKCDETTREELFRNITEILELDVKIGQSNCD